MSKQTRITLKNVKIIASMSHETLCFNASIIFDGQKIGVAENQGCGGETTVIHDDGKIALFRQSEEFAKGLLPINLGENNGKPIFIDSNLIEVIDQLVADEDRNRKTKSSFKRVYRKKICVLHQGNLYLAGYKTEAQHAAYTAQIRKERGPDAIILDDLDEEAAFALYSKHLYK